jgi:hypothetical protein
MMESGNLSLPMRGTIAEQRNEGSVATSGDEKAVADRDENARLETFPPPPPSCESPVTPVSKKLRIIFSTSR